MSYEMGGTILSITVKEKDLGAKVLRNADGGGGCPIFWKKALRRCNVQCY